MNLLAVETATDACSVALWLNGNTILEFAVIPRQHTQKILFMLESLLAKAEISFSQIDVLAFGCGPGSFTGLRIAASVIQGLAVARDLPVVPISTLHALAQGAYRKFRAAHIPITPQDASFSAEFTRDLNFFELENPKEYSLKNFAWSKILSRSDPKGDLQDVNHYFEGFPTQKNLKVDVKSDASVRILKSNGYIFSCLDARMNEIYGGYYCLNEATQQMMPFSPEFLARPEAVNFPADFNWFGVGSGCKAYLALFQKKNHFTWREEIGDIYPSADDVAELAAYRFQQGEYVSAEQAVPVYLRDKVTS